MENFSTVGSSSARRLNLCTNSNLLNLGDNVPRRVFPADRMLVVVGGPGSLTTSIDMGLMIRRPVERLESQWSCRECINHVLL